MDSNIFKCFQPNQLWTSLISELSTHGFRHFQMFCDPGSIFWFLFGPKITQNQHFRKYTGALRQPGVSKCSFYFYFLASFFRPQFWDRFLMDFGRKRVPKCCQNGCQNRWNFDAISEPAISCFFAKGVALKSFFYMIRGTKNKPKSIKKPCQNEGRKNYPKMN